MKKRRLGNTTIEIAPLAFGGNVFGWTVEEPAAFTLLDAFVASGFNCIDTADIYSLGVSETIIGRWLNASGKRDRVVLATKVGKDMGQGRRGLSRAHIIRSAEDSLRRLQTDHIDIYQSHEDDQATPLEETLEAYGQLIRDGKILAVGASNYRADRLLKALQVSRQLGHPAYASLQTLYNLYDRADYETTLEPLCQEMGLGVLTYFSLGSGFLTGKYRTPEDLAGKPRRQIVEKYLNDRGLLILQALDQVSSQLDAEPATVALAWLMARPSVTAAVASATSIAQLNDLTRAVTLKIDPASMDLLNQASGYSTLTRRGLAEKSRPAN